MSDQLREVWLANLAFQNRWRDYLAYYRDQFGTAYRCWQVEALHHTGQTKAALDGTVVAIEVQEGEEGVLFGSVTAPMVAAAVSAATGIEVDKRDVELTKPIKKAGIHEVTIGIYRDTKATVKALVGSKAIKAAAAEAAKAAAEEAVAEEAAE